jgi:hypothetical protein
MLGEVSVALNTNLDPAAPVHFAIAKANEPYTPLFAEVRGCSWYPSIFLHWHLFSEAINLPQAFCAASSANSRADQVDQAKQTIIQCIIPFSKTWKMI